MKRPNFFIVGAPRCGTTSMSKWLGDHPNIYMSPVKEPDFFNTDDGHSGRFSLRQYENLFSKAGENHIAVGEASAWYLFSREAVPNILRYNDKAKFIVMLRNPIEMAYSLHQQELYTGHENVRDFMVAWDLQAKRAKGLCIPKSCVEPKRLLYGLACKLGEQLARLYHHVPRERVLAIVLDDIKVNPRREYLKVLEFLGVPDDGRREFPVHNPAKRYRSPLLGRIITSLGNTALRVKLTAGIQGGIGILNPLRRLNTVKTHRAPLGREMWAKLAAYFEDDVRLLSELLDRDLSWWLSFKGVTFCNEEKRA